MAPSPKNAASASKASGNIKGGPASGFAALKQFSDRSIETGGKAAQDFFNTLDLRRKVYGLIDRYTLAAVMRLEKNAIETAAEFLYRTVHVDQLSKLDRRSISRKAYCNAIRTIDLSPLPHVGVPGSPFIVGFRMRQPLPIDKLPNDIKGWTIKFPNLTTVLNEFPMHEIDDAYTVHIDGSKLVIDAETMDQIDPDLCPFHKKYPPHITDYLALGFDFPPNIEFRQTFRIRLSYASNTFGHDGREPFPGEEDDAYWEEKNIRKYRKWLYENRRLDKRITRISAEDHGDLWNYWETMDVEECLAFLPGRRMREFDIPFIDKGHTPFKYAQLLQLLELLGPDLRILNMDASLTSIAGDWPKIISLLDKAFPRLQVLTIGGHKDGLHSKYLTKPISGLGNLRKLAFADLDKIPSREFAKRICGLGGADCVYQNSGIQDLKSRVAYSDTVRFYKTSRPMPKITEVPEMVKRYFH